MSRSRSDRKSWSGRRCAFDAQSSGAHSTDPDFVVLPTAVAAAIEAAATAGEGSSGNGGAELSEDKKPRYKAMQEEMSAIAAKFSENLLDATNAHVERITDEAALAGIPEDVKAVAALVELHLRFHGYSGGEWTDSAVRRYVRDAGPLLPRLHKLTRADCTTRNRRRARRLQENYDDLERRIAAIAAAEDLRRVRPDLDGNAIMALLGIPAGPQVGQAWNHLKELRLDRGPLSREEITPVLVSEGPTSSTFA